MPKVLQEIKTLKNIQIWENNFEVKQFSKIYVTHALQTDGVSCGPFTCLFQEYSIFGKKIDFTQNEVQFLGRIRILTKLILDYPKLLD